MTKRQKKTRIRQIQKELLDQIKKTFPSVEFLGMDEWPTGMVVFHVYAPYEETLDVVECVLDRIVQILIDEGLNISIVPVRRKPAQQAAA